MHGVNLPLGVQLEPGLVDELRLADGPLRETLYELHALGCAAQPPPRRGPVYNALSEPHLHVIELSQVRS